ncbi:MAG: tetratricopeptide repeat protein [Planctomycetes bacterium]|nr:tetratricopeptide repeat protein [Planctomycetota bacterium]
MRLVRAALLRARGRPAEALREYQAVATALDGDGSPAWWTAIEGVVRAQAEAGELGEARRVLSALMRRDRTFGGDDARARRLLDLMVQLDAAR